MSQTNLQNTAFNLDPRPIVAFDWSLKHVYATADGIQVDRYVDIDDLLNNLIAPTKLAAECTFESWDPQCRTRVLERLRAEGHELYVYRPLHTSRRRPEGLPKTDENDARVIYMIATDPTFHLYPAPATTSVDWVRRRLRANREYRRIRLENEKPLLAEKAEAALGPYKELPPERAVVLGNGRHYSPTLLAAVWFATQWSRSRNEYERLLGLHGSAYPSLLRSDIHTHVWRHAKKRGVTWSQFRSELRHLRRELRHTGIESVLDAQVTPTPEELMVALTDAGFPVTPEAAARAVAAFAG